MSDDTPGSWPAPTPPGGSPPPPTGAAAWRPPTAGTPAGPPPVRPDEPKWWRRRTVGLPAGAWVALGVAAVVAIVVTGVALTGDGEAPRLAIDVPPMSPADSRDAPDATRPGSRPSVPSSSPSSESPTSTPDRPDTTTDPSTSAPGSVPSDPEGNGKVPDAPLPSGDPERSRFEYVDSSDVTWAGTIDGVVEVPLYWDEDTGERCFVVVGTITPTNVPGLVSEAWSTPYVTLFVDGEEAEFGELPCATEEIAAGGRRSLFDANVTDGTEYAFFTEFSVPEDVGEPQAVAVGDGDDTWTFFDATLLDEVPDFEPGAVGELTVEPTPIADGSPGPFTYTDEFTGDAWSGSVAGLVEIGLDEYSEEKGQCYAVVGTVTADTAGSGVVTSSYAAPPIGLLADGRLIDDFYGCSYQAAEEAGYVWFNDAQITPGTQIAVYATLLVPDVFPGDLQAIVIGDAWTGPTVLAPHVLAEFPTAEPTPGPPPAGELAAAGTTVEVVDEFTGSAWTVTVHGYQPVAGGEGAQCMLVYASATPAEGVVGEEPPRLRLIAGGRMLSENYWCDDAPAVDAGYVEQWTEPATPGASVHLYAPYSVPDGLGAPQAIIVGSGEPPALALVTPAELPAPPPLP